MSVTELFELWCKHATADQDLQNELNSYKEAIKDRFYRNLEFGTGGMRGVIGAGTNRMNVYNIRRTTLGLAKYVLDSSCNPSVAISYDSRNKSLLFAKTAASVLAGNGIKVYIYKELMPTPMLSYAVRALNCSAGIMITASHNPAEYNGYKVYGSDGCQMTAEAAEAVIANIESLEMFSGEAGSIPFTLTPAAFDKFVSNNIVEYIDDKIVENYYDCVLAEGLNTELCKKTDLKVVFSPLNGAGNKPVREILRRIGISEVVVVPEQELPDGNFTTCPYPNPEEADALTLGIALAKKEKADLLLATDPDCDRVGIAVPSNEDEEYIRFSGNEVGAMLLEYICSQRAAQKTMPENPLTVKTIVTTDIIDAIAANYGVEVVDVLTGFKYIGEQIGFLEKSGEQQRYIFGFEESYGYLAGTYVRDKDAVVGSMLICEMAAYYKSQGISLVEAREALYAKYGVYHNKVQSFTFKGASGNQKMADIMKGLRENPPVEIAGMKVTRIDDYKISISKNILTGEQSVLTLPSSNVLVFALEDGAKAIIRPSGTEPKIKAYYTTKAPTHEEAEDLDTRLMNGFSKLFL